MDTTVAWTPGRGHNEVSATTVAETIRRLEHQNGVCSPAMLVDEARPDDSPLHPLFPWDDALAAEQHRRSVARQIIRSVKVTVHDLGRAAPAFVSVVRAVPGEGDKRGYVSTEVALTQPAMRDQVLQQALMQIRAWQRKYRMLKELSDVIEVLDEVLPDEAAAG